MSIRAKERLLNFLIILGVLALLFVVGYPQYKESLPSKVKIGIDKSFSSLPFYLAKMDTSRNYFALEKVEPEFIEITGDPLQGLKDGTYDVVAVPWYRLIISPSLNGDTVKSVSSVELKSGRVTDAIIVSPDSKMKNVKDLKGKTLGYMAVNEYLINLVFPKLEEDFKLTKVTLVPLQIEDIPTALTDKKADAIYLLDPYRGYMVYKGNKVLFEGLISNYIMPSMPLAAIVMRQNYVKTENRLAAIRMKNAIEATMSYLARNPEVAKNFIVKINGWVSDGTLTLNIRTPEYQRLSEINIKNVERLQTELVQRGIGTCGFKPTEFLFSKLDFRR
jgi:ABC-type nitrate/sulfonate/bicarbonate transport system substrate-binding protein